MARATFINAILSGKLNGTVYARNKGGAYIRNWVKPTNPKTAAQSSVRSFFSDSSKTWKTLETSVKNAWNYYATSYFKAKRIKPGVVYSGFNAFQSLFNTQGQAFNNFRNFSIKSGINEFTATYTNITLNNTIPQDVFTGQPINNAGESCPLNVISGTIDASGAISCTLSQGVPNGTNPLDFRTGLGGRKIGFLFFGNIPNSGSPTENNCLGFTGFTTNIEDWDTNTEFFTLYCGGDSAFISNRKMWYANGQTAILTAYAVSEYGELAYLGNTSILVGA